MSQKRPDIQGLRCICIFMVLLYHYYPRIFPQGRLGVDMFFVISGFLIALMLSKKKDGIFTYFLQFYWRRVKRILPLCYLVFLLSYITMYLLKLQTFVHINKDFGAKALLFLANVKLSAEDQYEAQLTGATVLLTHYWSLLSTEIQFYLLAPVIVLCVPKETPKKRNYSFILIALLSLLHYITTTETIAFNSPIARLWQFMAGFFAYYNCSDEQPSHDYTRLPTDSTEDGDLSSEKSELLEEKNQMGKLLFSAHLLSYFSLFIVCSIVFIPSPTFFLDTLFRVVVTLSTMWTLMAVGKNPKFLEHPWAVYMGDISFALYLVHWPILCFVKAFALEDPCVNKLCVPISFTLSMVLACFLHEVFEKKSLFFGYLQWGTTCNIVIIVLLIMACTAMVFVDFSQPKKESANDDFFERAIRLNSEKNVGTKALQRNIKWKVGGTFKLKGFDKFEKRNRLHLLKGGTGNLTILIIGNSYACNQADNIFNGLKTLHKEVYVYWTDACEAMLSTVEKDASFGCVRAPMKHKELVNLLKPDILFIVERGVAIKRNLTSEVVLEDKYMVEIAKNLEDFAKSTKRIFILGPIRLLEKAVSTKAISYLKKKQRLRDSPTLVTNDNVNQRIRLGKVSEVCPKCVVYEWEHVFYNSTGVFEPFDPLTDVMYFDDIIHLGEEGQRKMRPFYEHLGKEMEMMRKQKRLLIN